MSHSELPMLKRRVAVRSPAGEPGSDRAEKPVSQNVRYSIHNQPPVARCGFPSVRSLKNPSPYSLFNQLMCALVFEI
jgi:hypothetical protein